MLKNFRTKNRVKDLGWKRIQKELEIFENGFSAIGLFTSDTYPDGTSIAAIGAYNDLGTKTIPERPWMRNPFDKNKGKIKEKMKEMYEQILKGSKTGKQALKELGVWWKGVLQESITQLKSPPNAPSTIAAKNSSNPLIDTGAMRQSVRNEEFYGKGNVKKLDKGSNL